MGNQFEGTSQNLEPLSLVHLSGVFEKVPGYLDTVGFLGVAKPDAKTLQHVPAGADGVTPMAREEVLVRASQLINRIAESLVLKRRWRGNFEKHSIREAHRTKELHPSALVNRVVEHCGWAD